MTPNKMTHIMSANDVLSNELIKSTFFEVTLPACKEIFEPLIYKNKCFYLFS